MMNTFSLIWRTYKTLDRIQDGAEALTKWVDRWVEPFEHLREELRGAIEFSFPWQGRDVGMVGQGVACNGKEILYSVYPHPRYAQEGVPSKVYIHDASSGRELRSFDLPPEVKHAGGLSIDGDGHLWVADTRDIWKIDMSRARTDGNSDHAVLGHRKLDNVRGSALAVDSETNRLGIVEYQKAGSPKAYVVNTKRFFEESTPFGPESAEHSIPLPMRVQGAAWDKNGELWVSRSSTQFGEIARLEQSTGQILERHDAAPGIEDLEFDDDGKLWSLSEAGAKPYAHAPEVFPRVFCLDIEKLHSGQALERSQLAPDLGSDTAIDAFCQDIADRIAATHGHPRIDVVLTRCVPNASADPGWSVIKGDETIYINPDFVRDEVHSPDALAGVVLHEAGHVIREHMGYTGDLVGNHSDEFQADMVAARAMDELGYNREAFARLLETFGGASPTHPDGQVRAAVVRAVPPSALPA